MIDIGALQAKLKVDTSDAKTELNNFGTQAGETGNKFSSFISKAKGLVAGGAIALGVGKAVGKMKDMVQSSLEATDTIDKMSQKIGISKTGYQEWSHVASQSGVDVGVFKNGMKTLITQMDSAASGSQTAKDAFDKLGVSFTDNTGKLKDQETMMNEAVSALAGMEDGSERARLATELFGKAGTELAPILNSGVDGIQDLKDEAHDLGLVMSDETINAGVKLGDTIANLKDSLGMVGTKIATQLYPIIQQVSENVINNMPQIQAVIQKVFDVVSDAINTISPMITGIIDLIKYVVTETQTQGTIFNTIWEGIKITVQNAIAIIQGVIKLFTDVLKGDWKACWDDIVNIVKGVGTLLKDAGKAAFMALWDGFKAVWTKIWDWVTEKVNAIVDAFKAAFSFGDSGDKQGSSGGGRTSGKSHRTGLDYVPVDDYRASLHKGEMVLTAAEAERYRDSQTNVLDTVTALMGLQQAQGNDGGVINLTVQLGTDNFGNAVVKYGDEARNRLGKDKVVKV